MKILPVLFILFIGFGVFAQSEDSQTAQAGAQIAFEESLYEFGEITQGDRVEHEFSYTNTGTEPLVISSVKTTCGCTAPNWSREPLAPGETMTMLVRFNSSGKMGMQNKTITVNSNASNNPERIRITANVLPKPAAPATDPQ
jgi:hypothetical protein